MRIGGIKGLEAADLLRAGNVDTDGEPHAPGAHGIGDPRQAFDHAWLQERRRVVDIIDIASVDPDRCEQARVGGGFAQIIANFSALEEDRPAIVAASDAAVGVIPFLYPADGHGGVLDRVKLGEVGIGRYAAQQIERAKEGPVLIRPRNDHQGLVLPQGPLQPESVRGNLSRDRETWKCCANFIERADDRFPTARRVRARHSSDAVLKLLDGRLLKHVRAERANRSGNDSVLMPAGVAQPRRVLCLGARRGPCGKKPCR